MRRLAAALATLAAAMAVHAQEPARWYVQVDNDIVSFQDRWYTSGVRLARVQRHDGHAIEWGLLQEIWTNDPHYYEPGRSDRAPTARLVGSLARHDQDEALFQTLELQLGVRGKAALGKQATDLVHAVVPAEEFDWSRQERTRADVAAIFARTERTGRFQIHYGATLGTTLAFVHGGVEYRLGRLGPKVVSSPLLRFAATPPNGEVAHVPGFTGFVGASLRAVGRNEMLIRNHDPGGPDLHRHRWVGRVAAGVSWGWRDLAITFAIARDSQEFEEQHAPHGFGSLAVHFEF